MTESIEHRVSLGLVRYANVWEDADVLCDALLPREGSRFLSIASGGDNCFALLASGAEVVAADLSPAQVAVVELKRAAIGLLDDEALLRFLGIRPSDDRAATFARLAPSLPEDTRRYWGANPDAIRDGVVHAGKFERYFRVFRTRVLPWIHARRTVERLLDEKSVEARREFYERTWDNLRWRLVFRIFFSRFVMGRLGRDPEFFRYVEGPVADRILSRARYALTELPTHSNPYLGYILRGNFDSALPRYLRPDHLPGVRANLDRLTVAVGAIEDVGRTHRGAGFDGFNLSDVFEYLNAETGERIYSALLDLARPGARLAYWNMLAPRRCPASLAARVRALDDADRLFRRDLAFFYSAFVLEEVR